MTNKGHELTLTLKPIYGLVKGLNWELFGTYSKNVNKVVKITDEIDELAVGGPYTTGVSIVAKEGLPFGTFKGLAPKTNAAGQTVVDPNTGFPLYTDEEVYLGSYQPDYMASLGTNIGYKGLSFNILFDIKQGGRFLSQTKFFTEFNGTALNTIDHNREPFIFPNSVIDNGDGTYKQTILKLLSRIISQITIHQQQPIWSMPAISNWGRLAWAIISLKLVEKVVSYRRHFVFLW